VESREPEKLQYSIYNPLQQGGRQWGGTLYGSPGSGEYHDDFLGSMHYGQIVIEERDTGMQLLKNVLVLRSLQGVMDTGLEATLYLLSETADGGRSMLVAVRVGRQQREATATIGGLAATLRASFRRQARRLVIPLGMSLGAFVGIAGLVLASLPAEIRSALLALTLAALVLSLPLFGLFLYFAWSSANRRLDAMPNTATLRELLREDGFGFPPAR